VIFSQVGSKDQQLRTDRQALQRLLAGWDDSRAAAIVDELGISETVFGLLVVAVAVSFEELVLEMLPAYRRYAELAVGNALGTLVFLLTLSLGVIALVRPVDVPDQVRELHAPALVVAVAVVLAMLARGRLSRVEGGLLIGLYALYASLAVLAG
jgi:cation:H+ antiporter